MPSMAEAFEAWEKAGYTVIPVPGTKLVRLICAHKGVDILTMKDRMLIEVVRTVGRSPEQIRHYVDTARAVK